MFNYMYSLGFKLPKTTFYQNHPRITHVFYSTHALFMIISCDHPSRCTDTPNRKLLQYITVFCFTSNSFCNKTINSTFLLFCKVVRIAIFFLGTFTVPISHYLSSKFCLKFFKNISREFWRYRFSRLNFKRNPDPSN